MVILFESANAPPFIATNPFHEIKMITGTTNVSITDRRLRHCVVKSARKSDARTEDVLGITVCMDYLANY
jgi:hypothetical protein